jgi:hypothetical protein
MAESERERVERFRKRPVLLRRAPLSGRINALTNYRWSEGKSTLKVLGDGKHDVTAAFYALMLEELMDGKGHAEHDASQPCPNIIAILDGVADGDPITDEQRGEVRALRERLKAIADDHNARIESGELSNA